MYRTGALIGSGHFGEVRKGVWNCAAGMVEVAIKKMKKEAKEEDKIRFLQEAAIMAQFKHPNVVSMHGAVTAGEPVSVGYSPWAECRQCRQIILLFWGGREGVERENTEKGNVQYIT